MSKTVWITALFFFAATVSGVTINLEGDVRGENNQAVAHARVSLKKHPAMTAFTDASGSFSLSGTALAATGALTDTLVVVARGYRTLLTGISSYDQSRLHLSLAASNPWVPSGPLEYSGGMVKIKAKGHDFEMGQPCDTVRGVLWDMPTTNVEQPVHTVQFTYDFWIDTVEVTQGEYDSLMNLTYPDRYSRPTWNASNGLGARWAAYSVEWGSAALFCNARSRCEGLPDTAYSYTGITGRVGGLCTLQNVSTKLHANAYRLPTEAEWEYAYRAGTTTDYYWGREFSDYPAGAVAAAVDSFAIWNNNSFGVGRDNVIHLGPGLDSVYYGAHEVGKRKPNAYGLYDMAGNLSEWCNDWYDYYPWGVVIDPMGSTPANPASFSRVQRGGNWSNDISYLRATERQFDAADYKFLFCGFRTATSGRTSGVIRKTGRLPGTRPSVYLRSRTLFCDNAAGCAIALFTLGGKKVYGAVSHRRTFSFSTRTLSRGSYIVRVSPIDAGTIIHLAE